MRYLDAVSLAKLRNLRLELGQLRAEGASEGRHRSAQRTVSREFSQHRQYSPGDEIKTIDWKVYARKDRYFVKQSQEDRSLRTYLLVDASGSMGFKGSGASTKLEHACRLAAALAYLIIEGGDAAGLVTFGSAPRSVLPPREALAHLELIDAELSGAAPSGETDMGAVLRQVAGLVPRRCLVVLLSDLLGDAAGILEVVLVLRARKHEVLVLQVLDPDERDLPYEGPTRFESLEDASTLLCEPGLLRAAYREEFDRRQRLYQSGFHRSAVPFATAYTDAPWEENLARLLSALRWSHS